MFGRRNRRARGRAISLAILTLYLVMAPATSAIASEGPPTGDRVFDAMVLRPLSAIGTVVGFGFFVCSLPLAAPTLQTETAWDTFVKAPAHYAFQRELGDF